MRGRGCAHAFVLMIVFWSAAGLIRCLCGSRCPRASDVYSFIDNTFFNVYVCAGAAVRMHLYECVLFAALLVWFDVCKDAGVRVLLICINLLTSLCAMSMYLRARLCACIWFNVCFWKRLLFDLMLVRKHRFACFWFVLICWHHFVQCRCIWGRGCAHVFVLMLVFGSVASLISCL